MEAEVERLDAIIGKDGCGDAARAIALGRRAGGVGQRAIVLDEARQGRPGQVEAVEIRVAMFEFGDDPQALGIVVEAAVSRHAGVERVLAGMAERRVAEVVAERHRFGEVVVEAERARERPGDFRHLDRMGEPGAEMVALVVDEDLGLVGEAAEGGRVDDAVAVPLEVGAGRGGRLGEPRRRSGIGRVRAIGGARRARPGRRGERVSKGNGSGRARDLPSAPRFLS